MEEAFAARFAARRKEMGLTQANLADRTGLTVKTISYYETGKTLPDLALAVKLSVELDCSIDWLAGRDRNPAPPPDVPQWFRPLMGDIDRIKTAADRRTLRSVVRTLARKS
jgi:transcriptional regulator with XRE-family HTH domain